jgi:hypothetical protein
MDLGLIRVEALTGSSASQFSSSQANLPAVS